MHEHTLFWQIFCGLPAGCRGESCRTSSGSRRSSDGSCGRGCGGSSPESPARRNTVIRSMYSLQNLTSKVSLGLNPFKIIWKSGPRASQDIKQHALYCSNFTSQRLSVIGFMLNSFTSPKSWYMYSRQLSICHSKERAKKSVTLLTWSGSGWF